MPEMYLAKIENKEILKDDIIKFTLDAPSIVEKSRQGQFIEIRVTEGTDPFLRRPISIHNINKEEGTLDIIFQLRGKGTNMMSKLEVGDSLDIIAPLGNGTFNHEKSNKLGIIGGGIGIFPLYELAKNAIKDNKEVRTYLGFRNKDLVILEADFKSVSTDLIISTDDGSYGREGFAISFLEEDVRSGNIDSIYACGPLPMLKAVKDVANKYNIACQISLEEKMACGMGLCLGCAVKVASSTEDNPEYVHVCKAGPVFDANYVEI